MPLFIGMLRDYHLSLISIGPRLDIVACSGTFDESPSDWPCGKTVSFGKATVNTMASTFCLSAIASIEFRITSSVIERPQCAPKDQGEG